MEEEEDEEEQEELQEGGQPVPSTIPSGRPGLRATSSQPPSVFFRGPGAVLRLAIVLAAWLWLAQVSADLDSRVPN